MPKLTCISTSIILIFFFTGLGACSSYNGNQPDKRTPGSLLDDQFIESVGKKEIRKADLRLTTAHLSIVSMNGIVLLVGQVASDDLIQIAESTIQNIEKVRSVHNELTVGGPISLIARSNDTLLTGKIKTKLVASDRINSNRVKVITEDSIVYLMGRITREKADIVVNITRKTSGVKKVVKVFEYL